MAGAVLQGVTLWRRRRCALRDGGLQLRAAVILLAAVALTSGSLPLGDGVDQELWFCRGCGAEACLRPGKGL